MVNHASSTRLECSPPTGIGFAGSGTANSGATGGAGQEESPVWPCCPEKRGLAMPAEAQATHCTEDMR